MVKISSWYQQGRGSAAFKVAHVDMIGKAREVGEIR
jgi:hypothetical protein